MEIRNLDASEIDELLNLYRHLHTDDEQADAATLQSTWQRIIDNPNYHCMGLFIESTLVSSCCLVIIDNLTRGCRPYGVIENVVTHNDHRRRRYGHMLLKHCLSLAWSNNCYKVMLMTGRLDEKTFAFYESAGFDRTAKQAFVARATEDRR